MQELAPQLVQRQEPAQVPLAVGQVIVRLVAAQEPAPPVHWAWELGQVVGLAVLVVEPAYFVARSVLPIGRKLFGARLRRCLRFEKRQVRGSSQALAQLLHSVKQCRRTFVHRSLQSDL